MSAESKITKFRAYQLASKGSSFSYYDGEKFTLIEARYNEKNKVSLKEEMDSCGISEINCLHITSWDVDHCSPSELQNIIDELKPKRIEYPGYEPHTESGKESLKKINKLKKNSSSRKLAVKISPDYIRSLKSSKAFKYTDLILHPKVLDKISANDNSTIKFFRSGSFNVLSLGDVESSSISSYLTACSSIKNEVDILILAHHGADNGFTTSRFLRTVKPKFAICSSNYDNQYEHPKPKIKDLLYQFDIPVFTTKTGDVIIRSTGNHVGNYKIENMISNNDKISSEKKGTSKKKEYLSKNNDTISSKRRRPIIK